MCKTNTEMVKINSLKKNGSLKPKDYNQQIQKILVILFC